LSTTVEINIWDVVNSLERYDYTKYLRQIAGLSKEQHQQIFADWRLYRRAYVWIVERTPQGDSRKVRFHPRQWQLIYETTRSNFDISLKSRKVGFTTDVLTEMYAKAATREYQKQLFMSYEEDASVSTAAILQVAHELNPMQPPTRKNNTTGIVFRDTHSSIGISTAGAKVLARGLDLTMLHMTEVAHFYKKVDNADNFVAGVLDAVAPGGRVVQESTANGEDPIFYPTWQQAQNGELWKPSFISVFMDERTDWSAEHPEALMSTRNEDFDLSNYERGMIESFGATRGNVRFLRYEKQKLRAVSAREPEAVSIIGDERMLLQEYPTDDVTCFLTSSDTVFDGEIVKLYRMRAKPPWWMEQNGELKIWEKPLAGRPYVVFVDTSKGLPTSDWQAAAVLDVERLSFVAILHCKTDMADLGKRIYKLGEDYNGALVMVERNNHGDTLLYVLDHQLRYPNLYSHDESGFTQSRQLGWPTDGKTKPIMVSSFKELFEAGALDVPDVECLREIAAYRFIRGVARSQDKYQAPAGGHDDLVIALMGAIMGRDLAYVTNQSKPVHYGTQWGVT